MRTNGFRDFKGTDGQSIPKSGLAATAGLRRVRLADGASAFEGGDGVGIVAQLGQDFVVMLSEQGRRATQLRRRTLEFDGGVGDAQFGDIRVLDGQEHRAGVDLLVGHHIGGFVDGANGDAGIINRLDPMGDGVGGEYAVEQVNHLGAVGYPVGVGCEPGVVFEFGVSDGVAEALPEVGVGDSQDEIAVGGLEALVRHQAGMT